VSIFRLIGVCLAASALGGCGDATEVDHIRRALDTWTLAYNSHDVQGVCGKLIASTVLPRQLGERMGVPWGGPGTTAAWDREYRECVRGFEIREPIPDWRVVEMRFGPTDPKAGITRTARVTFRIGRAKRLERVWLVKFRGDWKLVFEVN
jgi:hypothetical protein